MKIIVGSDHNGYALKDRLVSHLLNKGHQVEDSGTHGPERVLVDRYALEVANGVVSGRYDTGLLVCGTGQGMAIFANKVRGARAALCNDVLTARMARQANDANVLTMGSDLVGAGAALAIVDEWLEAEYLGEEDDTLARLDRIEEERG